MGRKFIVVGDDTDHGGKVISGSSAHTINGKGIARKGDKVDCPQTYPGGAPHGENLITEGESSCLIDGMPVALEGHKAECGCALVGSVTVTHG
jgi:uncharacterized Zn-binding protein involved in type VI secretion